MERVNSGVMKEDEFWFVALEFAEVVVERARGIFKTKETCDDYIICLLYTSPSPRDKRQSRMPSSA